MANKKKLNSTEKAYQLAYCLGYIEGTEGGENQGAIKEEIINEALSLEEFLDSLIEEDKSNKGMCTKINNYLKSRAEADRVILDMVIKVITDKKSALSLASEEK